MFEQLRASHKKGREFRRNATLSRLQLEDIKLAKFRELVRFVNERSPYYARVIAERRLDPATCVPTDFPVLTKSLLMANFDDIVTDRRITKAGVADFLTRSKEPVERYLDRFTVIHTSGSSGEVGYFVYAPDDLGRALAWRRQNRRFDRQRRKRGRFRVAFYGATDGHYAGVTMVSQMRRGLARLFLKLELFEVNSPLPQVLEGLNAFQPDFLIGYTTALKILAEQQRAGLLDIAPLVIGCTGEATTPGDKASLSGAFGCGVMNTYGCSEHLGMGAAAPDSDEIVLFDDDLMFEFHSDHCLVTNLFNRTLPLIRYRMSDTLRPVDGAAHAPYMAIESLVGRNEVQPVFRNAAGQTDFISPHTINEVFVKGVTRFQLHWLSESRFHFLICVEKQLNAAQAADCREAVGARLREILARKGLSNVAFTVERVDDIPLNARTRKFQLIVDKRQAEPSTA